MNPGLSDPTQRAWLTSLAMLFPSFFCAQREAGAREDIVCRWHRGEIPGRGRPTPSALS